jgi:hypothetical protein
VEIVVVGFLHRQSLQHARFVVRRLKRIKAELRVGIVFWSGIGNGNSEAATELAGNLNADFVAFDIVDAVTGALSKKAAVTLRPPDAETIAARPVKAGAGPVGMTVKEEDFAGPTRLRRRLEFQKIPRGPHSRWLSRPLPLGAARFMASRARRPSTTPTRVGSTVALLLAIGQNLPGLAMA